MSTVTLSPTFDLHVPDDVRQAMRLQAGTAFRVVHADGRLQFIPEPPPIDAMRGFLRGMDPAVDPDEDRL